MKTPSVSVSYYCSNKLSPGWGFPGGSDRKESACNVGDPGSIHGLGRSPGEGNIHSHILAWRIHGQRSLVGYSPWGHTAELLTHFSGLKQLKLFSYSSSGQKCNTSLSRLKSRCLQDCIPLETLEENLFPTSRLTPFPGSWSPSSIFQATSS